MTDEQHAARVYPLLKHAIGPVDCHFGARSPTAKGL
jgi:hypothetical protein